MIRLRYYFDFDNDNFLSTYAEITDWVKSANWSIGIGQAYQLMGDEQRLTMQLQNSDRRWSPDNEDSPYAGTLLPYRRVKVMAEFAGSTYPLYTGYASAFSAQGGDGRTAEIQATGPKDYMQQQRVYLPLLEEVRSDEIIEALLKRLTVPPALDSGLWLLGLAGQSELGETTFLGDLSGAISLDTGDTSFPFAADNWSGAFRGNQYVSADEAADSFTGYDAIADVVMAERGRFFFDREGNAIFWNRSRLQKKTGIDATWDNLHQNIRYEYAKNVKNVVTVTVYPRLTETNFLLWELEEAISLRPGQDRTIRARFADNDSYDSVAAKNVVTAGVDADAQISIDLNIASDSAEIILENTGDRAGKLRTMQLRGDAVLNLNEIEVQVTNGESIARYGRTEMRIDSRQMADDGLAQNIADYELSRRKEPVGEGQSITFAAHDPADEIPAALDIQMGHRVRVKDAQLVHDAEYFVIGERWRSDLRGGVTCEKILEPADSQKYWVLGVSGFSELGDNTILGL